MDGPEHAQARLEQYLAAAIPAQLDLIAAAHQVDRAVELPNPTIIAATEISQVPVKNWPFHTVSILDTLSVERVDHDIADLEDPNELDDRSGFEGPEYRVIYLARVFTFARGKAYADTNAARFRYALAVRMALLGRPSLDADDAAVDEISYRESYSDIDTEAARTIGAAYAEFRVAMAETLTTAAPNYAGTLEVVTITMPTAELEVP